MCVCVYVCACACVHARARARACVCVCVCVRRGQKKQTLSEQHNDETETKRAEFPAAGKLHKPTV